MAGPEYGDVEDLLALQVLRLFVTEVGVVLYAQLVAVEYTLPFVVAVASGELEQEVTVLVVVALDGYAQVLAGPV